MAFKDWLKEYRETQGSQSTASKTSSADSSSSGNTKKSTSGSTGSGSSGSSFRDTLKEYREAQAGKSLKGWAETSLNLIKDVQNYSSNWYDDNEYQSRADKITSLLAKADNWRKQYSGSSDAVSYINSVVDALSEAKTYSYNTRKYYSQWNTAEDFSKYKKEQKDYEDMVNFDLDAGQKEIENLEAVKAEYKKWRLQTGTDVQAKYRQFAAEYGDIDALDTLISEKRAYLNRAKHIQEGVTLAGAAGNADFKEFSGYVSTKSDNWWDKLTSQYGMKYDDLTYEYINNQNGIRDEIKQKNRSYSADGGDGESTFEEKGYDYMTEDEVGIYNYYYAKDGKEAAEKYLNSIQESLSLRKATGMYENMEDKTLLELAFGVAAGLDQFESGMKNLFNTEDDYIPQTATQMASGMVREDLADAGAKLPAWMGGASLGQMGYDAITTTANMAPSILTSVWVGMVNPIAGEIVGTSMMGASAAGNAYQEALNLGYDKDQARGYANMVGASEAVLGYLLGGVSKLGGKLSNKAITGFLNNVDNALLRTAGQLGGKMLSEFSEEYLQEVLTPVFSNLMLGTDEEIRLFSAEALYSGLLGALTAGVMEGGGVVSGEVNAYTQGKALKAANISAERLAELGQTFSADTVAYQLAGRVNEKTGAYTMGRLFNEIGATLSEQNVTEITEALVAKGMDKATARKNADALAYVVEGGQLTDRQVAVIEANDILAEVARTTLIDTNTTWNQRSKGYNEMLKALADEMTAPKASRTNPAQQSQDNAHTSDTVDAQEENGAESLSEADTVDTSPAKVKSFSTIEKGRATIKLEDDSVVDVKKADLSPEDGVRIETIASIDGISVEDANFVLNTLRTSTNASAQMDALGAKETYKYGFYGFSQDHIAKHGVFANSLTETQRQAIYEAGKKARQKQIDEAAPKKAKSATTGIYFDAGNGNVVPYSESNMTALDKKQSAGVQTAMILRKLGIGGDIYFFKSYINAQGRRVYKDKNGKEVSAPNGWYSPGDGSIHIDLNAGNKGDGYVLYTLAHELTHFIEEWSAAKYKVLADFLIENYEKGQSMDKLVRAKQAKLSAQRGKPVPYKEAYSEVIADSMEAMLADGNVLEKLIELRAKDNDISMKMKQFFDNLLTKIRNAYKGLTPDSNEGKAVLEMTDSIEKLQQLFAEALVDAGDNFRAAQEQFSTDSIRGNADGAVAQSEVTTALTDADGVMNSDRTEFEALPKQMMSLSTGAGTLLHSIEGLIAKKIKGLSGKTINGYTGRDVRGYAMGISGFTQAQIQEVNKFMDAMAEFMEQAGVTYRFIGLQDVKDAKLHYTYNADGSIKSIVLSAMVKNGDYPVNFDLSSICKKRVAMSTLIDKLARRGSLDSGTVKLTPANIFKINTALKNAGYETACLGCFVESKRYNSLEWANKFCNKWNAAVKKVNPNATYFGYGNATFNEDSFTLEQAMKIDAAATKYITTTKTERLANALAKYKAKEEAGLPLVESFSKAAKDRLIKADISEELKTKYLTCDVTTLNMADVEFLLENGVLPGATLSNKQAVTELVKSGEAYQHLLRPSDLLTDRGISKLEALPNFHGVLYGHYGSGTPKLMQSYTPYNSEIALLPNNKNSDQTLAEYLYTIAGVRMQSFSDFQIQNIYDYLQMVADLAARKVPAHAYTKEISFAKLLGMTGIKCNLSVMFDIDPMVDKAHAGLTKLNKLVHRGEYARVVLEDAQGKWVYNIGDYQTQKLFAEAYPDEAKRFLQSIGFADAVKLQSSPGYSANCGIIGVGYSDLGIFAMLDDNRIRYIIPYHASSLPAEIKLATHIALGTDYTPYQNNMKIAGIVDRNGNKVDWTIKEAYKRLRNGQAVINELNEKIRAEGWVVKTTKAQNGHGSYGLYEDLQQTNDPRQTASNFMDWCIKNSTLPLFYQFASHENYYKMLYDFNVYDCVTEEYAPQQAVTNTYPTMVDGQVQPGDVIEGGFDVEYLQGTIDKQMAFMDAYNSNLDEDLERLADSMEEGTMFSSRDESNDSSPAYTGEYPNGVQFQHREDDPAKLKFLNDQVERGEYTTVYKALLRIGDTYYPPMASLEKDENGKYTKLRGGQKLFDWIASDGKLTEEMKAKMNMKSPKAWLNKYADAFKNGLNPWGMYGDFKLKKADESGKSQGDVPAAYNPYQHSSDQVLNDQFDAAYDRPGLVVVECRIPNSELTDPYWAPYAKDPTGMHEWKTGPIAGQLKKTTRHVYMTRWIQPIRELSHREVAERIRDIVAKEDTPPRVYWNNINPKVLQELINLGVEIDPYGSPTYLTGKNAVDMYGNPITDEIRAERKAEKEAREAAKKSKKKASNQTVSYSDRENGNIPLAGQETVKYSNTRFFPGNVFPSGLTHTSVTEWANRKDVKTGDKRLVLHRGAYYRVEKFDDMDFKYLITKKYDAQDYEEVFREYEEIDSGESYESLFNEGLEVYRARLEHGQGGYYADPSRPGYGGEDRPVYGVGSVQDGQRKAYGEAQRGSQGGLRDQRQTGDENLEWTPQELYDKMQDLDRKLINATGRYATMLKNQREHYASMIDEMNGWDSVKLSDRDSDGNQLTEDQQEFFEGSKARDENGNLYVLYHGSRSPLFTEFDMYEGVWLTPDQRYAEVYAEMWHTWRDEDQDLTGLEKSVYADPDYRVYKMYANITNPLDLGEINDEFDRSQMNRLARLLGVPAARIRNISHHDGYQTVGYVYEVTKDHQFIEIAKEKGYDGFIASERGRKTFCAFNAPNQVKLTTNEVPSGFYDIRYQDRDTESVSNRSLLANALEGVAQNDIERNKIQEYKGKIDLINAEERKLSELNEKIKDLSFSKGPKDTKAIRDLQFEARQTANRINTYDKQLLRLEASKPLQDVLDREKKLAYKKAEKQGKEALAAYKERAAKTQRELMDKWQESRKRGIESREKTAMRHKIQSVVGELNQLLLSNDKKRHVPDSLKKAVADALSLVNMDTVGAEERAAKYAALIARETDPDKIDAYTTTMENILRQGEKMGQRLKDLRDAYEEIQDSDDPDIANAYDPVIAGSLKELSQSIGNTSLRDMTIEQLSDVYDMYRMVLTRVRDANKSFLNEKKEAISNLASRVVGEVRSVGGEHKMRLAMLDPVRKFLWNNLKPVYAFEYMGSNTLTEAFNTVRKGEDVWAKDVTEAREYYLDKSKKYGYDTWDFKKKYRFESTSGQEFELTLDQILSLYAYSKREQAHDHLRLGGFVFDSNIETYKEKDSKTGKSILKYMVNTADAHQISTDNLAQIIGKLSSEQMAFVDEMQEYLSTVMGAKGNEVTMKMYGVKLFKEKFYFPLKSAKQFMFEQNEVSGEVRIKNSGFTNKVVAKANNPVILSNFMDVWSGHVNDMSMYHSFVLPLEDFNRVFNYNSPKEEGKPPVSVKGTIQSAYSPAAVSYVKQLITDLNGGARSDPAAGFINKMMGLFKKGSVFASLSVVVQQPSAIARAAALVDTKYFIGPKVDHKRHKALWDEVKKYAPVAIIKEMGYFDTNMGKSTQDFIQGKEYSGFKEKMKALVVDSNYRDEILSKAPALADEIAWCSIWEAVKRETKAKYSGLDVKSEPFLMLAGSRFTEVISKTQVYDSILSRSANMRSKDTGMKMATAFMAEPTTSINMIADALLQGKRGNRKYARAAIGAVIASQLLNSILVSFVYAGRDDDEDETYAEKYIGTVTGEFLDSLNPAGYIPFIKDIQSIVQGYDVERSDMAVISDLWNAWQSLSKDNVSVYRKVEGFAGSIAQIFGLPVKNIMRDVRGIYQTIDSFVNGQQTTGTGIGYAVKGAITGKTVSDQQQLYEAYLSGDKAHIARVSSRYKDQNAAHSALRKALRENDPRIREAAIAWNANDLDEYMRIAKQIIGEKHFTQDDVVMAIRAEASALAPDTGSSGSSKAKGLFTAEKFVSAIAQGDEATANAAKLDIIQTAQTNGKTEVEAEKSFASSVKSEMKEQFLAGTLTEDQAIDTLVDYCGETQEDAEEYVGQWAFQQEYGFSWSDRADAYKSGQISAYELRDILVSAGGKTEEEAMWQVKIYDWQNEGFDIDSNQKSVVEDYETFCEPAGIDKHTYFNAYLFYADSGEEGVAYSKTIECMPYIDSLPLSSYQKTALAKCWWAESTVNKYKTW